MRLNSITSKYHKYDHKQVDKMFSARLQSVFCLFFFNTVSTLNWLTYSKTAALSTDSVLKWCPCWVMHCCHAIWWRFSATLRPSLRGFPALSPENEINTSGYIVTSKICLLTINGIEIRIKL